MSRPASGLWEQVQAAAAVVRSRSPLVPEAAVILGTGLGGLADEMQGEYRDRLRGHPRLPAVHRRDPRRPAPARDTGRTPGRRHAGPLPSLRGVLAPAGDLPGAGAPCAGCPGTAGLQCLRRDEPALGPRRPGPPQRPHQPAGRQSPDRPQRRTPGPALSGHVRAVRQGPARPGPIDRAGGADRAPRRGLRRGARARTSRPAPNTACSERSAPTWSGCPPCRR